MRIKSFAFLPHEIWSERNKLGGWCRDEKGRTLSAHFLRAAKFRKIDDETTLFSSEITIYQVNHIPYNSGVVYVTEHKEQIISLDITVRLQKINYLEKFDHESVTANGRKVILH